MARLSAAMVLVAEMAIEDGYRESTVRALLGLACLAACSSCSDRGGQVQGALAGSAESWGTADTTLLIGSVEGHPETTLYLPRYPRFAGLDSVSVVNGLTEIRIYSRDGRLVQTLGSQGQGPGEFTAAYGYGRTPDGGFTILDQQAVAIRLDRNGREVARRALDPPMEINLRAGYLDDGRVIGLGPATPSDGPNSWVRDSVVLWIADPTDDASGETIDRVLGFGWWVSPGAYRGLPLAPRPTVEGGGSVVAYSDGITYSVALYDPSNGQRMSMRLDRDLVPLEPRHLEGWIAEREELFRDMNAPPRATVLPDGLDPPLRPTLPAWDALLFDDLGCLWARNAHRPGENTERWDVLDPAGRHLAQVELPADFRLEDVRGTELLGLTSDPLGVEYVMAVELATGGSRPTCSSPFGASR